MSGFSIALIGVGRIGLMHAGILTRNPLVERLVVVDNLPDRADVVARDLNCDTASLAEVLDPANPVGLDGIVIATGTSTHADLLIRAAATGVPTYCEKPIGLSLPESLAAQAALEEAQLPHHIGFQRRFDTGYTRARELLHSGELGELRRFHALTCDQFPPADEFVPGSGGAFVDMNSHDFDIIRWVTGREVVEVYATGAARGSEVYAQCNDFSETLAVLTLDDGTVGSVQSSRYNGQGHEVRLDLMGTKGSANVGLDNKAPLRSVEDGVLYPPQSPWTDFIQRFQPCFERELDHFLNHPVKGLEGACTAADAVEALKIAIACRQSALEKRPVAVAEVV